MSQHRPSRSIRLAIALSLVLVTLTGSLYWLLYRGPMKLITHGKNESLAAAESLHALALRMAGDLKRELQLQPHVVVNNRTVVEASTDIAELATREKTFQQDHVVETTWLGSSKRLHVRGQFKAKAGFDGREPLRLERSDDRNLIKVTLPPPRLLSLEQTDIELVQDENGYWNKITTEQREEALRQLTRQARQTITQSGILDEASRSFVEQINVILRRHLPEGTSLSIGFEPSGGELPSVPPTPRP